MEVDDALDLALELADAADAITMERFRAQDLAVETKPDMTPVSEADRAVERAIRDRLARAPGSHAVWGEEYGDDGRADPTAARWIVDPIDGTKGYIRGLPVWATLLALEQHGEIAVGVVSAPALGARWWAARGRGAHRSGDPVHVSRISKVEDAQFSFSWDHAATFDEFGPRALALARRCWRARSLGDFWHHVLVADGSLDASAEPAVAPWDVAPLVVILEEAGGRCTDLAGTPVIDGRGVVCSNGRLHDEVLAALAP